MHGAKGSTRASPCSCLKRPDHRPNNQPGHQLLTQHQPYPNTTVTVVMATYNGAAFLTAQLASLAAQTRRPDRLVLRDDASTDQSVTLVREWAASIGVELQLVPAAERLGPARSFLTALQHAQPADVYLFCDQDDVWLPHKVERSVQLLDRNAGARPHLLATSQWIVNAALQEKRLSQLPRHLSFSNAVYESALTGCTMAFNSPLRDLLVRELPQQITMHDWWCYLVASGTGRVSFDDQPSMLYRQHGGNALGAGPQGWALHSERLQRFVRGTAHVRSGQLREFFRLYMDDATPEASRLASLLLQAQTGLRARCCAALVAPVHRQAWFNQLTTRISLLANRF